MSQELLRNLVLALVPLVLSFTIHEFAHAWVATRLGDDTPERQGRLTLSPLDHIDPVGSLLVPSLAVIFGGIPFLAWARPVECNPAGFRRDVTMRSGLILVAVAGPLSNLGLAILSLGAIALMTRVGVSHATPVGSASFYLAKAMFGANVGQFVLNMLPVPPFDGSRLLPARTDGIVGIIHQYSWIILLVVLMVPLTRTIFLEIPTSLVERLLLSLFGFA